MSMVEPSTPAAAPSGDQPASPHTTSTYTPPSLATTLAVDAVSGTVASFFLAPFIAIVDVSIIRNANGSKPLNQGLKEMFTHLFTKPHQFLRTGHFLAVWLVYAGTYSIANWTDTYMKYKKKDPGLAKFAATAMYNLPGNTLKDRAFTRWFGVIKPAPVPIPSLACFVTRDAMTLIASFTAPAKATAWLKFRCPSLNTRATETACQLVLPGLMQFASTPIHLLGLDMYNNKGASVSQKMGVIRREYFKSVFARNLRIGFAYGIGGVSNTNLRRGLQGLIA
eukprot:TRINITY_DN2063_c1_g3_i1.p1 TRINITY_DN2063_c1_g3~~TRINITY_DN2063_c1_g3_i1.p1  ORF type:complete len:280 (+),score=65.66 TRINITY_DN2063_c1_g3_i1:2-841(+)